MNNDMKFLIKERRTQYSLTNFEDHFGLHASVLNTQPTNAYTKFEMNWVIIFPDNAWKPRMGERTHGRTDAHRSYSFQLFFCHVHSLIWMSLFSDVSYFETLVVYFDYPIESKSQCPFYQVLPLRIFVESEWVIKFNGLSRTADSEVHKVHISRVIIACTLKSLSSPT